MLAENPFKGPTSYEDGDQFYGREAEIKELKVLIKNDTLTLLFARSGIGKSSLIKAGLIPELKKDLYFLPIYIHLDEDAIKLTTAKNLVDFVIKTCIKEIKKAEVETNNLFSSIIPENYTCQLSDETYLESLFKFIHSLKLWQIIENEDDKPTEYKIIPLLIFDQFEEIFTKPVDKKQIQRLVYEVRCLIENEVPLYFKEELYNNKNENSIKIKKELNNKYKGIRFLFSFREEYLPHFKSLRNLLPSVRFTNGEFRLEPFSNDKASEIITKIAPEVLKESATEIAENIGVPLQILDEKKVDPFLLSLICQIIYPDLVDKNQRTNSHENENIQILVMNAIESFIEKIYSNIDEETKIFIEKVLITTDGRKNSINYNHVITFPQLKKDVDNLISLPDYRLLNKGEFLDSEQVSILHDRLLPPLIKRKHQREEEEKQALIKIESDKIEAKLKNERDEENLKNENEKKANEKKNTERRKLGRLILGGLFIAIITSLILLLLTISLRKTKNGLTYDNTARRMVSEDPTLALRLSEASLKNLPKETSFNETANGIYSTYAFYKILLNGNETKNLHSFICYDLSLDSNYLLTGSLNADAILWDLKTKDSIRSFNEAGQLGIISVAYSPVNNYFITNSLDSIVRIWNRYDKEPFKRIKQNGAFVNLIKVSPDGNSLLVGYNKKLVMVYDLKNSLKDSTSLSDEIISASFTFNGKQIVTGSKDGIVTVWKKDKTWDKNISLNLHDQNIKVAFSPKDSNIVATTMSNGYVGLWNLSDSVTMLKKFKFRKEIVGSNLDSLKLIQFNSSLNNISALEFSPDGMHIITGSSDRKAIIWNLNGESINVLKGHKKRIVYTSFSKDGTRIFTGSDDNTFREWKMEKNLNQEYIQRQDPITNTAFKGNDTVLTASVSGLIRWNFDKDSKIINPVKGIKQIKFLVSASNGNYLTVSEDSVVNLWSFNGQLIIGKAKGDEHEFEGLSGKINSLSFSPDGKEILIVSDDKFVRLYRDDGSLKSKQEEAASAIAFSPDAKEILTGSIEGEVALYENEQDSLKFIRKYIFKIYDNSKKSIKSLAVSPNRQYVAVAFDDSLRVWNFDGSNLKTFHKNESAVVLAFNPANSMQFITGSNNGKISLWNVNKPQLPEKEYKGHSGIITSLSFSPNGTKILSCSSVDQSVKIWNTQTTSRDEMLKGNNIEALEAEVKKAFDDSKNASDL